MTNEYGSPHLYDAEYGAFTADFPLFLEHLKTGPVLDLACGTGRLTQALAKTDVLCIGLDSSPEMLARAKEKSKGLNCSYVLGDMRSFHFDQSFDLIAMTGNSFQALLEDEDQRKMMTSVKENLKPDGFFIFNTRNPSKLHCKTLNDFEFWHDFRDPENHHVKVYGKQHYDPERHWVHYITKRVWDDHESLSELTLRFTDLTTIQSRLDACGLEIISVFGDWNKTPYSKESENIIIKASIK
jgi:SAM-dependent methyltransferase